MAEELEGGKTAEKLENRKTWLGSLKMGEAEKFESGKFRLMGRMVGK